MYKTDHEFSVTTLPSFATIITRFEIRRSEFGSPPQARKCRATVQHSLACGGPRSDEHAEHMTD